jgi:hypothetical protein
MNKKLIEIKNKITEMVNKGEHVDKVIEKTTLYLSTKEKIELKLLFEDAMRTHRLNAENWTQTDLIFPLSEILKSRLFVYPESSEQYYGYEPSPLEQKIQRWKELENEEGGLYALIYNDIEKRNKAIYDLADKVARNNQSNIDLGIFISELDKHITRYSSDIDLMSGLHLRYSIPQKNILVWDTLTCAENIGGTNSQTFGRYKISCKFQWEILNRTPEPEVGYLQIEENDDVKNLSDSFSPIFVEMVENFYDLDKKLDLLYNILNDIRQTNDRVTD